MSCSTRQTGFSLFLSFSFFFFDNYTILGLSNLLFVCVEEKRVWISIRGCFKVVQTWNNKRSITFHSQSQTWKGSLLLKKIHPPSKVRFCFAPRLFQEILVQCIETKSQEITDNVEKGRLIYLQ